MFDQEGLRLRIYLNENSRFAGLPLHEWIIKEALRHEIAGATLIRGVEGFGCHKHTHSIKLLSLSDELPVILEIIDSPAKVERFVSAISSCVKDGMMTAETVRLKLFN